MNNFKLYFILPKLFEVVGTADTLQRVAGGSRSNESRHTWQRKLKE